MLGLYEKKFGKRQQLINSVNFNASRRFPIEKISKASNQTNRIARNLNTSLDRYSVCRSCSPGYTFSKLQRFDSDIYQRFKRKEHTEMSPIFVKNCLKTKENLTARKIRLESPEEKLKKFQDFCKKDEINGEISRLTRNRIVKSLNIEKHNRLNEKFSRFEMRKRKPVFSKKELNMIKMSWFSLYVTAGFIFVVKSFINNRRRLFYRIRKRLVWFIGLIRAICRFIRLKKNARIRLSFHTLKKLVGYMKVWIKNKKKKYAEKIASILEQSADHTLISSVMYDWKEKILHIQRLMKYLLKTRANLYASLHSLWNIHELKILHELLEKKEKKRVKKYVIMKKHEKIVSWIPGSVKLSMIKQKTREILGQYIAKYRLYKSSLEKIECLSPTLSRAFSSTSEKRNKIEKPSDKIISKEFTPELFRVLIEASFKDFHKSRKAVKFIP